MLQTTTYNPTRQMILCGLFAALIAVGAFIQIPIPAVPFTLQFLFTTLAGLLLGPRWGAAAVGVYIVLGLIGLPVFANGGGLAYVFQPTFGYLLGFYAGTYVTGKLAGNGQPVFKRLLLANLAGLVVVYLCGMLYYYVVANFYIGKPIGVWPLLLYCFLLPVPGDLLICWVGGWLGQRLIPLFKKEA